MTEEDQITWLAIQASAAIAPDDALGWSSDCGYI